MMVDHKTALITGANGFIGNAVARAFSRAGWRTYGLVRRAEIVPALARDEIRPIIGTPEDLSFLDGIADVTFDVVVSNTEDHNDAAGHLERVGLMLEQIGSRASERAVRPLMMFSSGCKDYGAMVENDGDPGLVPHTEASPINPPAILAGRTAFGLSLLGDRHDSYDATVLRPTNVYGHGSSQYGLLFDLAAASERVLRIQGSPHAVMHALHVDDCAEAYVRLAEHDRAAVRGQAFNISNARYDTARSVGEALARLYGLEVVFEVPPVDLSFWSVHGLANFSQWVSSDKLRALTAWRERKPTFPDGVEEYRLAYEATKPKSAAGL